MVPQRLWIAFILLLVAIPASAETPGTQGILAGQVSAQTAPLPATVVYAYQLADYTLSRATTDEQGRFLFESLPAGLYKIIAFKPGFLPAIIQLARNSQEMNQFLELHLVEAPAAEPPEGEDFWALRSQIPPDVLRDIVIVAAGQDAVATQTSVPLLGQWSGRMTARTGVDQSLSHTAVPLAMGRIDLEGQLRRIEMDLEGAYARLGFDRLADGAEGPLGTSRRLNLVVKSPKSTRVQVTTTSSQLSPSTRVTSPEIDFQRVSLSWSQDYGEAGQSEFVAHYTTEDNFYQRGLLPIAWLPENSQAWNVAGHYATELSPNMTLEAGMRYRTRNLTFNHLSRSYRGSRNGATDVLDRRLELYGESSFRVTPRLVLEYGVHSSLYEDGSAISPQAGVVMQLAPKWQASASASRRIDTSAPDRRFEFVAASYDEWTRCDQIEAYCYQISFTRDMGEGESLRIGAVDRRFDQSVRLYFNDDFFRHLENLYLVEGDRLPEVRFTLTRRITPHILARLSSSVASGGGGRTSAVARQRLVYENEVGYVVTSLETRFEPTATGVEVTFHRLHQELDPLSPRRSVRAAELERLQLLLSQDLNALIELAARWVLQLNMEFSRGGLIHSLDEGTEAAELRRRITGGVAVSF